MPFEAFEHTADVGLRIWANDLNGLFAEAGRALFSLIVPNLESIRHAEPISIELSGERGEYLLFDWLNELLYQFEVRHLLLGEFDVQVSTDGLKATAWGEPIDLKRHSLDHEVKAITYHGLTLERQANLWRAEVIVDI